MPYTFRFYRDEELYNLDPQQVEHLSLVDQLLARDEFADVDIGELESLTTDHLRRLLHGERAQTAPRALVAPRALTAPTIESVTPATLADAFAVRDGRLMRRIVMRTTVDGVAHESVEWAPTGGRVRFGGRVYRTAHLAHWLTTGEWITRRPRTPRAKIGAPRYRAQVREGARRVHLGYYPSPEARDAAILTYRLTHPQTPQNASGSPAEAQDGPT